MCLNVPNLLITSRTTTILNYYTKNTVSVCSTFNYTKAYPGDGFEGSNHSQIAKFTILFYHFTDVIVNLILTLKN